MIQLLRSASRIEICQELLHTYIYLPGVPMCVSSSRERATTLRKHYILVLLVLWPLKQDPLWSIKLWGRLRTHEVRRAAGCWPNVLEWGFTHPMPSSNSTRKKFKTCSTHAGSWFACIPIKGLHSTSISTQRCRVAHVTLANSVSTFASSTDCRSTSKSDPAVGMVTSVHSLVTSVDTSVVVDGRDKSYLHYRDTASSTQPGSANHTSQSASKTPRFRSKYRHVEALHKTSRPSVLSHDSEQAPSFLGFRNLMVLTISESIGSV